MSIKRRDFIKKSATAAAITSPFILSSKVSASNSLKVWKFGGTGRETEYWPVRNKVFSKNNPSINLNYQYFYCQIRRNKIMAGFQTKKLADIIIAFGQDIPEFEVDSIELASPKLFSDEETSSNADQGSEKTPEAFESSNLEKDLSSGKIDKKLAQKYLKQISQALKSYFLH